jgi:hypothetical protein
MMTVRKAEVVWCGVVSWWGDAMGSEDEWRDGFVRLLECDSRIMNREIVRFSALKRLSTEVEILESIFKRIIECCKLSEHELMSCDSLCLARERGGRNRIVRWGLELKYQQHKFFRLRTHSTQGYKIMSKCIHDSSRHLRRHGAVI